MAEPLLPLLVEPDELEKALGAPGLAIVDVGEERNYLARHVPGAVLLPYRALVVARPPAGGLLPGDAALEAAFSAIGLTPETHVVAYDAEGGTRASRLLWTLDEVGHARFSLLDGGLHAWVNEGHRTEEGPASPKPATYKIARHGAALARKDHILAHIGDPKVLVLDARTPAEYSGADVRSARRPHSGRGQFRLGDRARPGAQHAVEAARGAREGIRLARHHARQGDHRALPDAQPLVAHLARAQVARLPQRQGL
jgi:thiosulfate/3-mercaptopyruvate sulfurtransferase